MRRLNAAFPLVAAIATGRIIARCSRSRNPHRVPASHIWRCSMRAAELGAGRVAIWGLGREGRAAIRLLRKRHPAAALMVLDEAAEDAGPGRGSATISNAPLATDRIASAPRQNRCPRQIARRQPLPTRNPIRPGDRGTRVTSLLNLWFAERPRYQDDLRDRDQGKSTTASLIAHILARLGRRVALAGNIGVPITEIDSATADYRGDRGIELSGRGF